MYTIESKNELERVTDRMRVLCVHMANFGKCVCRNLSSARDATQFLTKSAWNTREIEYIYLL